MEYTSNAFLRFEETTTILPLMIELVRSRGYLISQNNVKISICKFSDKIRLKRWRLPRWFKRAIQLTKIFKFKINQD